MSLIAVECVVVAGFQKHARCYAPLRLVQCAECFVQSEEDHVWRSARYDARYSHRPVWSVYPSNNYYGWRSGVVEQALPIRQSCGAKEEVRQEEDSRIRLRKGVDCARVGREGVEED